MNHEPFLDQTISGFRICKEITVYSHPLYQHFSPFGIKMENDSEVDGDEAPAREQIGGI
jgi:hypothetical protein